VATAGLRTLVPPFPRRHTRCDQPARNGRIAGVSAIRGGRCSMPSFHIRRRSPTLLRIVWAVALFIGACPGLVLAQQNPPDAGFAYAVARAASGVLLADEVPADEQEASRATALAPAPPPEEFLPDPRRQARRYRPSADSATRATPAAAWLHGRRARVLASGTWA